MLVLYKFVTASFKSKYGSILLESKPAVFILIAMSYALLPDVIILETFNGNSRNRERRVIQNDDMIDLPMNNQPCRRFSIKLSNEAGSHFTIYGGIQIQYEGKVRPV